MRVMLDNGAYAPERAHKTDAGFDLRSPVDVVILPRSWVVIDTGVHVALPYHTVGLIKSKSGLNVKYGIQSEGVVDEGYRGSIRVKLYNHSDREYMVSRGDKITQLVIVEYFRPDIEIVDELDETDRGNNGFGSTGK
jgi:dUTP pyrophosphatase